MSDLTLGQKMLVWILQGLMEGVGFGIVMMIVIYVTDKIMHYRVPVDNDPD
jgi:Na+-translocating ferredoxin:NAD+ oxidoreductase RnfA subunit